MEDVLGPTWEMMDAVFVYSAICEVGVLEWSFLLLVIIEDRGRWQLRSRFIALFVVFVVRIEKK